MNNYDDEIRNAISHSDEKTLLEYFIMDNEISDAGAYFFCKRYCTRNISTVVRCMEELYGRKISAQKLRKAMYKTVQSRCFE